MKRSAVVLFAAGSIGIANAAIVIQPPDLNPGDPYRLLFVTSSSAAATSTSIATYNAFVNSVADTVTGLADINWMVVGSTASVAARDNTGTNPSSTGVPVYLLSGVRIANDYADLWDGSLAATPNITETGGVQAFRVFTGTTPSGTPETYFLGWGAGYGDPIRTGAPDLANSEWMVTGVQGAGQPAPFYAMSEILVAPEPGALILLPMGALVMGRRRRLR